MKKPRVHNTEFKRKKRPRYLLFRSINPNLTAEEIERATQLDLLMCKRLGFDWEVI